MEESTFTVAVSSWELAFILHHLQAEGTLLSLFEEDLDEEKVSTALQSAQQSLLTKGYMAQKPDGTLVLDVTVAAIAGSVASADMALSARVIRDGESALAERYVYYSSGLLVEQELDPASNIILTAVENETVLLRRLTDFLQIGNQPAPFDSSSRLPDTVVLELANLAAGGGKEAVEEQLIEVGAPSAFARALAKAFARPRQQSVLQCILFADGQAMPVRSMRILEEVYGLWLFQKVPEDGADSVEVIPVAASEVREKLGAFVRQISSTSRL